MQKLSSLSIDCLSKEQNLVLLLHNTNQDLNLVQSLDHHQPKIDV